MWAEDLFKSFRENDIAKERELANHVSKTSLESIKSIYKKRRKQGMTPFIVSILHDNIALCEQLIKEGIDFDQQCLTLFFDEQLFIKFNNDASKLITLGPNSNVFTDFNQTTPMFWAIKCTKLSLIDKLISSGHNINGAVEKFAGMRALSFAILCGNITVVKHLLLNHTCNIHESSLPDMKPLDVAIRSGNEDMVRVLLKNGDNPDCANHQLSPLLQAVFLNNLLMVSSILSMGANVNFGVETGKVFPPLNMAILRGHFNIASLLVANGADVFIKDSTGNTALHLLLTRMKVITGDISNQPAFKLAQLLIEKGAKVDIANNKGEVPLLIAICLCEPVLVDLFLSNPVDLNTPLKLKPKATFLHIGVSPPIMFGPRPLNNLYAKDYWKKRYSIAQSLIKKGADVNKQSGDGRTPLHFAAESGYVKLVKLLLSSQVVDVNKLSANGKVALHYAAYSGSTGVVKLLLESGAEVNVRDIIGSTPLDFGIMENERFSCETAKLFIDYGADIYNCCSMNSLKVYDVLISMMRTDVIKLFWREGYPYDFTVFQLKKNFLASMKAFFHNLGQNNIVALDFKKRLNKGNSSEIEELLNAQSKFITGVEKNNVKMVLSALQKGAEVGGGSLKVPSPLHFLAKRGFTDVAQVLLSKGVKPNTVDSEGNIPVDLAVQFGHFKMYMTLLQYGACYKRTGFDTSLFQKEGNNKINEMYVLIKKAFKDVKRGNHRILKSVNKYVTLKEWDVYRALVNCVDEKGRTLMQVAMDRGHKDIVQKLMEYRLQAPETDDLQ